MEGAIHCPLCPLTEEVREKGVISSREVQGFLNPDAAHRHMISKSSRCYLLRESEAQVS